MAVSPLWRTLAGWLGGVEKRCDIGLHLTLTDHQPIGSMPGLASTGRLPSVGRLMRRAFAGALEAAEVRDELRRQWDAFIAARGRPPDFLDGHQHVHLLPGVRQAVLELLGECAPGERPYVRLCWEAPVQVLLRRIAVGKALFLSLLSVPLRREVSRLGFVANDSFRGVHTFDAGLDYAKVFPRFLTGDGLRPLIMCHPGFVDGRLRALDSVTDQRQREYDYFASERFSADLEASDSRLVRFREIQ
jgi:chitin disaccharide deacetylase